MSETISDKMDQQTFLFGMGLLIFTAEFVGMVQFETAVLVLVLAVLAGITDHDRFARNHE